MTIKNAKAIIKEYFELNAPYPGAMFNKELLQFYYDQKDYIIEFDFFVDSFGGKICLSSQCVYRIKILDDFYSVSNFKRFRPNNFGCKTIYLHNTYEGLDKFARDNDFRFDKDDSFEKSFIIKLNELVEKIAFILDKLKYELENNLKSQFNLDKSGIFEFIPVDKMILYHYFKPDELYNYLVQLKESGKKNTDEEYLENYKILLFELCKLNNFDYEALEPKQTIFTKVRSIFKVQ